MFTGRHAWLLGTLVVMLLSGCTEGDAPKGPKSGQSGKPAPAPAADYLLASEPADAKDVRQVRQSAANGDQVVVVGRIGGEVDPWVEGLAAFNIVDRSLQACNERAGDTCQNPWDFCCEPELADCRLLVKVVDARSKIVSGGAQELLGLKELQTVVVNATAKRDEAGNVTLLASGVFVRP